MLGIWSRDDTDRRLQRDGLPDQRPKGDPPPSDDDLKGSDVALTPENNGYWRFEHDVDGRLPAEWITCDKSPQQANNTLYVDVLVEDYSTGDETFVREQTNYIGCQVDECPSEKNV